MELTRTSAVEIEYWPTMDPTIVEGSRDQRLDAYRAVRDELERAHPGAFRAAARLRIPESAKPLLLAGFGAISRAS